MVQIFYKNYIILSIVFVVPTALDDQFLIVDSRICCVYYLSRIGVFKNIDKTDFSPNVFPTKTTPKKPRPMTQSKASKGNQSNATYCNVKEAKQTTSMQSNATQSNAKHNGTRQLCGHSTAEVSSRASKTTRPRSAGDLFNAIAFVERLQFLYSSILRFWTWTE